MKTASGRVFICHHEAPERVVSTSTFSTLVSGARSDARTGALGDLDGTNIAAPNRHSEMRHQFHVCSDRLGDLDYVGFEHYRRLFLTLPFDAAAIYRFDPGLLAAQRWFLSDDARFLAELDGSSFHRLLDLREVHANEIEAYLSRLMSDNDIVTQRPCPFRIDSQWRSGHDAGEWDILVEVIRNTGFFARSFQLIDFSLSGIRFCNMYIARRPVFVAYMDFWHECMRGLEPRIEMHERHLGFFSERLLTFFVYGMRLQDPYFRVGTLPCVIRRG